MISRRWVSREEVAEIHDVIAVRAKQFVLNLEVDIDDPLIRKAIQEWRSHLASARDLRDTEALGALQGRRAIARAMDTALPDLPAGVGDPYSWGGDEAIRKYYSDLGRGKDGGDGASKS